MPVVRERAAAHLDNARREQRCNWVSDTCNRSPTHGPETCTEASTDPVEKVNLKRPWSSIKELLEWQQSKFLFRDRLRSQMGVVSV